MYGYKPEDDALVDLTSAHEATEVVIDETVHGVDVFDKQPRNDPGKKGTLAADGATGLLVGELSITTLPAKPDQEIKLYFDSNAVSDMWIAMTWSG